MATPYIYTSDVHNLNAPTAIVPLLVALFAPKSVLDIGCGTGTFLKVFQQHGINDVLGIDGPWVNKDQWLLPTENFLAANLEAPLNLHRKFDMVLCLEVAEHLLESAAPTLVASLVQHGDCIIFSAAMPGQGGQGHINEQLLSYWVRLFQEHEYFLQDILRSSFWQNENIDVWYKQNIVCFLKEETFAKQQLQIVDVIHPEMLLKKTNQLEALTKELENIKSWQTAFMAGAFQYTTYLKIIWKKWRGLFKM